MAITGTVPLKRMQAGKEASFATVVAATRKQPFLTGDLNQHRDVTKFVEDRGSLTRHYRPPIQTTQFVEISGMTLAATFETMIWVLNYGLNGGVQTGTTVNTAGKHYAFSGAATSNTLNTATLEVGDDTQAWIVPGAQINRWEFGWSLDGASTLSTDWLGQRADAGTFTAGLSDRAEDDINGSLATMFLDATTIGSTAVTTVQDFKLTVDNHLKHYFAPNGNIYPNDIYPSEPQEITMEMTLAFLNTTEYLAFTSANERKVRTKISGPAIAGASNNLTKSITIDGYYYIEEAPFGTNNGLVTLKAKGDLVRDTTSTTPLFIQIDCADATVA